MAFGVPTTKHFLISFNYWVDNQLYTGEFASDVAVPQGYNSSPSPIDPAAPESVVFVLAIKRLRPSVTNGVTPYATINNVDYNFIGYY